MLMDEPEPRPRNLGGSSPFQRELGFAIEHLSDGDILLFLRHGLGRRIVRSVGDDRYLRNSAASIHNNINVVNSFVARELGQGHHLASILLVPAADVPESKRRPRQP